MSAMVVTVIHFAFNSTEPSIKITRSVHELKLEATNCLPTSASNSFQSERMSVLVLSRKSQATLIYHTYFRSEGPRLLTSDVELKRRKGRKHKRSLCASEDGHDISISIRISKPCVLPMLMLMFMSLY